MYAMPKKLSALAVEKLIQEALAIEEESAKDAGALGFIARCMVQATLPHSQSKNRTSRERTAISNSR